MTPTLINRRQLKAEAKTLLADAQVSPKTMVTLYLGLLLVLDLLACFGGRGAEPLPTFLSILTGLISLVLSGGFTLYCMTVRRGERAELCTLFDGFSMAGKIVLLNVLRGALVFLWSMLFFVPGVVAIYRYRFALYNLYENPQLGVLEALRMSRRQTAGYKMQLFSLDLSYIGWFLLASLPLLAEVYWYNMEATQYMLSGAALPETFAVYAFLPDWGWLVVAGLWQLTVSLFYMTQMQCVDLAYFDEAKSTSGASAAPQDLPDGF